EFPLPKGSGPHGLVSDVEGNIWFTAISGGYVGRLDPKTGAVKSYPMPGKGIDPHTPIFDGKGILWFTAQKANVVGRLDPKTGDVRFQRVPTDNAIPYGIVVTSTGVP